MKVYGKIGGLCLGLVLVLWLTNCSKDYDDQEMTKNDQNTAIEQYLDEHDITAQPTTTGLYYILLDSSGRISQTNITYDSVYADDYVLIEYEGSLLDGALFGTSNKELAKKHEIFNSEILYGPHKLKVGASIPGLQEGLQYMRKGDSAQLIIPSDLAYGDLALPNIPPNSNLVYHVKMLEIIRDPGNHENLLIDDYLGKIDYDTDTTESGVIYFFMEQGDSLLYPAEDSLITFHYSASLIDGRLIESTFDEDAFSVQYKTHDLIDGLEEGLEVMTIGSRVKMIIPYNLAHGAEGRYVPGLKQIPPYSTMLFEVELLDVSSPR